MFDVHLGEVDCPNKILILLNLKLTQH